eukprot:s5155_g3.t1
MAHLRLQGSPCSLIQLDRSPAIQLPHSDWPAQFFREIASFRQRQRDLRFESCMTAPLLQAQYTTPGSPCWTLSVGSIAVRPSKTQHPGRT